MIPETKPAVIFGGLKKWGGGDEVCSRWPQSPGFLGRFFVDENQPDGPEMTIKRSGCSVRTCQIMQGENNWRLLANREKFLT